LRAAFVRPRTVLHIEDNVWLVVGERQGRFPRAHAVIVRDDETILIDSGCGDSVLCELETAVGRPVDRVINTHTHPDHCAGNPHFRSGGRRISVPESGAASAGNLVALSERFFDAPELRPVWRRFIRAAMDYRDCDPTDTYSESDIIDCGKTRLRVVHTPGHTVDHCCLWIEERGILISADLDLTGFGPWYGHPECSLDELRGSLARVRALEPALVLSAHRMPIREDIDAAFVRYAEVLQRREETLLRFLSEERSWEEIVEAALVYGRFPYEVELMRYWEGQMIGKHLAELVDGGAVEVLEGRYRRRLS